MELGQAAILAAFFAGVLSFLSPCVLTMMPTYTTVLAGSGCAATGDRKRTIRLLANSLIFLSGFVVVFLVFGIAAFYIGQVTGLQEVLHKVGAVFMIVMGLQMTGTFSLILPRRSCSPVLRTGLSPAGVFLLGVASTVAWAPCNGPLLASVLSYFEGISSIISSLIVAGIYSAGFCIPFLLLTHCLERCINRLSIFSKKLHVFQQVAGFILVVAGLVMYFDLL